jgi:hypothetical protein
MAAMDREQAREKFKLADRLFNEQQYGPALKVLTDLNAAFPNERHVLYPMARCLTGLGRNSEALDLADRVVRQFDYAPAMDLYKKLRAMKTGDGLAALESSSDPVLPMSVPSLDSDPHIDLPPGILTLDSDPVMPPPGMPKFDSDPPPLPKELDVLVNRPFGAQSGGPPVAPPVDQRNAYLLWGALVVGGFIAALVVALTAGRPTIEFYADIVQNVETYEADPSLAPPFPGGSFAVLFVAWYAYSFILGCMTAYFTLKVLDSLPFGSFGDDMKDVALYSLYFFLLSWVPVLGWIGILVILKRHYDLSVGTLIGAVLLYNIFGMILNGVAAVAGLVIILMMMA